MAVKTAPAWQEEGLSHIWLPYTQMQTAPEPQPVTKAQGCTLTLADGSTLIDGVSSWWSVCHGYNHPHIVKAMEQQLADVSHVMFAGLSNEPAYTLATRLSKLTGLERAFFSDSGSTAVETAMKMAVQYWRNRGQKERNKFVCFNHGYHGDTMGCMSLADPERGMHKYLNDYMPMQYAVDIPKNAEELAAFEQLLAEHDHIAAVFIEPLVQGAGGMKFHSAQQLADIYKLCKKQNVLFIADEVMTGFGRTGHMFACQEASITPDIMVLGKALTGGMMTLAAVLASEEIFDAFLSDGNETALMSGPTFMGNPLACSAANASLDLFENEPRLEQVAAIETQLSKELSPLQGLPGILDVRVKGAIGVVEMDITWQDIQFFRDSFIEQGVWLRPFGNIIYIMPPFTISESELASLTLVIVDACREFSKRYK